MSDTRSDLLASLKPLNELDEAAAFCGNVHPDTLRKWVRAGRGPAAIKLGKKFLFARSALVDFVLAHGVDQEPKPATASPFAGLDDDELRAVADELRARFASKGGGE